MELYTYYRSSAAYRVRIMLNLKKIEHKLVPVNLLKGEESENEYLQINPQGFVPCLKLDDGRVLPQSQAILDYLESQYPEPALLSADAFKAAQQKALSAVIACDIHPLNNLRVLKYLTGELGATDDQKTQWYAHWIEEGFCTLEPQLQASPYALDDKLTLLDVFLIPQVYNALRFKVSMDAFPKIKSVYESCNQLQAFVDAAPENQPDAI